jgi:asparagine synthase (glutamine-hydrolysing)
MCGIAGMLDLRRQKVPGLARALAAMGRLIAHRGPDGYGEWISQDGSVGLVHRRLAIIDLTDSGAQPMMAPNATVICYNGEIYNYHELRDAHAGRWTFRSSSDTETILAAYEADGTDCLAQLRGMFAFVLWDERRGRLFCARDRFGVKPFYYAVVDGRFHFASEAKALLPFLPQVATDPQALAEYITFQYTIGEHTLFRSIKQLLPGHALVIEGGAIKVFRYWDVNYEVDFDHSPPYFEKRLRELADASMRMHLRADVPMGSYLSGGIDSSLLTLLAGRIEGGRDSFHGRFTDYPGYDESRYAGIAAAAAGSRLHIADITAEDFRSRIGEVIYHLDFPVAGPGSFAQFMVSALAAKHVKVVFGAQGGDEIFGGYARYLLAYFEQCIKAAIDGTYKNGNFVVTPESIIPNLGVLREYKPLIAEFWREGLFSALDDRYFRLVDRSTDVEDEIEWRILDKKRVREDFGAIFNNRNNVRKEAYFDSMTHFDFKCLLPALLHVEDRMSMAHGLESRVPLLDHPLVEFAATVPADVKFRDGHMKHMLRTAFAETLPREILDRRDKMGFPVPLKEWFAGPLKEWLADTFYSTRAQSRDFVNVPAVLAKVDKAGRFSRKIWGLLSLELWQQHFHDRQLEFRTLLDAPPVPRSAGARRHGIPASPQP